MRAKPKRVVIWVTEEKKKVLKEKAKAAGNCALSDYMLQMEDRGMIYVVEDVPKLLRQLSGMANNLNQLTHLCHIGKIKDPEILVHLKSNMNGVKDILRSLNSLIARTKK
ncbi:MobC family plasmid mobilization relaxosome protein [Desulfosporosinus sp. I2]|uniref:MobC family plasmid mobilization relaxosome protein n=1 Tax=Desulfosporosinus sp. I2 TaxID=1617025 RepID=UPI0005EE5BB6|nr:MobC family plasmid mobilization relaxosome protein [Desulfosporosinus sp. I2]